jgi:hypothetical protein
VHHAAPPFLQRGRQRSAGQVTRPSSCADLGSAKGTYADDEAGQPPRYTPARTGMRRTVSHRRPRAGAADLNIVGQPTERGS